MYRTCTQAKLTLLNSKWHNTQVKPYSSHRTQCQFCFLLFLVLLKCSCTAQITLMITSDCNEKLCIPVNHSLLFFLFPPAEDTVIVIPYGSRHVRLVLKGPDHLCKSWQVQGLSFRTEKIKWVYPVYFQMTRLRMSKCNVSKRVFHGGHVCCEYRNPLKQIESLNDQMSLMSPRKTNSLHCWLFKG